MKQIKTLGWLVMAAALITTFAACSNDDNDTPDTPAAPAKSITITVGAGITDDNATRSAVEDGTDAQGKATHTLKFTTGDKLFVRAMYGTSVYDATNIEYYYEHIFRGYLTMSGSPSADRKSATFTGNLVQYDRHGNEGSYTYTEATSNSITFTDLDDAAKDSNGNPIVYATLVHNGATEGEQNDYVDEGWNIYYNASDKLATGDNAVNTLMTKWLTVTSPTVNGYVGKVFKLNDAGNTPIVNCTINGLTKSTEYTVTYVIGDTEDDKIALSPSVTTDEYGTVHFAFFGDESASTHALTFTATAGSEEKTADLGSKSLGQAFKIFNVTRTAN